MSLTTGAVSSFVGGRDVKHPVLQVIDIKRIEANSAAGTKERFRLVVSDGQYYQKAMLSTQLNGLISAQQLKTNSIVTLTEYICNDVQGRRIVIILSLQINQSNSAKIGNPQNIETANQNSSAATMAPGNQVKMEQPRVHQQPQVNQQSYGGGYQGNGPVVRQQHMTKPMQGGQGMSNNMHILPIRALNPYQNKWTIKGRVTSKAGIRTWDKGPNNQGKLFSCEIVDAEGTELRMTFFRDAVDKYYEMLQQDKVFTFSGGQVKMANKQYNTTNNDYEVTFGGNAEVYPVENDNTIAKISLNPVPIASLDPGSMTHADILGVVSEHSEIQEFTSKAGRPLTKVDLTIADNSGSSVRVAFWGDKGREIHEKLSNAPPNQIIGVKNCKISDYNGCSLSTMNTSNIFIDPELPQTSVVRQWLSGGGLSGVQSKSQSAGGGGNRGPKGVQDRHTTKSLTEYRLGTGEKPDYVDIKGTITYIKRENMWYPACPEEGVNKKVVQQPDGSWFCEQTNKSYPHCEYRYIMSCVVSDSSGSQWVTCFNETGQQLLGRSADDLARLKEENESLFDQALMEANFSEYIFTLRVKEEMNNDETRLRCSMIRCTPIDWTTENRQLIAAIENFA